MPNRQAYEMVPIEPGPHGPPHTWWTVKRKGIPVRYFPGKEKAERHATDREYRASLGEQHSALNRLKTKAQTQSRLFVASLCSDPELAVDAACLLKSAIGDQWTSVPSSSVL